MKNLGNSWTAKQFIANLNPLAVTGEKDDDGAGVYVKTSRGEKAMGFWIDIWVEDGELCYDWNQYIFNLTDENDCLRKEMQEDADFFDMMTSEAVRFAMNNGLIEERVYLTYLFGKTY